jgi:hypothetical protein
MRDLENYLRILKAVHAGADLDESLRCANSSSGNAGLIGDQEFKLLAVHATRRVDFLNGEFCCVLGGRAKNTRCPAQVGEQTDFECFRAYRRR